MPGFESLTNGDIGRKQKQLAEVSLWSPSTDGRDLLMLIVFRRS
jgi:hypothetical protein